MHIYIFYLSLQSRSTFPPNIHFSIILGCSSPAALHGNLTVWMNLRFTKKKSSDFRWAVKHFSLATAGLRGFIWFCADRCRGEAFRLINCPHRVGERDGEKEWEWLSVPAFILSQRRLVQAHLPSLLPFSSPTHASALSALSLICRLLPVCAVKSCG